MPEIIHPPDEAELIARAIRAVRAHGVDHRTATVQTHDGRRYVLLPRPRLRAIVFRHHNSGQLRRMTRPPGELIDLGTEDAADV